MTSSSSSTSRHGDRITVYGVPTRCWCGQGLDKWVSETNENPCRRFYRCKLALQKKTEKHLFKWIEEALLDEIRMVDAKALDLQHDLQTLAKNMNDPLESQRSWFLQKSDDLRNEITESRELLKKVIDEAREQMEEQTAGKVYPHINTKIHTNWPLQNIAAALAFFGAATYLYWKLL